MSEIYAAHLNSYHGFSMDDAVKSARSAGFAYCELAAVRGWTEHVMPEFSEEKLAHAKAVLKENGLTPISMSGHCNLMDEDRLEDFRKNIALAAGFGCKYIISSTGEAHFGKDETFTNDALIANIKKLLPDLEKYDMKMGLETHGIHNTGSKLAPIITGVGSDRVGICYDTANCFFYGKVKPEDDVDTCIDLINSVHLKDHRGPSDLWDFPGTGNGELNLKAFMDKLTANGYDGYYAIEIEYTEGFTMRDKKEGDLEVATKEMTDSYNYLKSLGRVE